MKIEASNIHKLIAAKVSGQGDTSQPNRAGSASLGTSFVSEALNTTKDATAAVRQLADKSNANDSAVKEVSAEVKAASGAQVGDVERLASFLAERIVSNPGQAIAAQANISEGQVGQFLK